MSLPPGHRLGVYEVQSLLGAGGMGEVYRARDGRLHRDVAIKILPASFAADPERMARFEQEARAAAALNHPNIVAVHDLGEHEGAPFLVTELLEGMSLRDTLREGALPPRKAIDYGVQIAQGLAAAHEKGIVHRDLKPDNLFITSDGRVKILDFGLAKLTQPESPAGSMSVLPTTPAFTNVPNTVAGVVLGTMGYMSPEQVRGVAADHHADIFALGVVLYEMLAGQRAFNGDTAVDVMSAILKEDPPELSVAARGIPPAFARVVVRCLEKNPASRFQSARDLAFALDALSAHTASATAAVIPDTRPTSPRWVAYESNESGRFEVYLQQLPANGSKFQVSTAGGELPQWRADGRELFYVENGTLFAVPITLEPHIEIGMPKVLFKHPNAVGYAVSADGQRILGVVPAGGSAAVPPVTAILNWAAGVKH